MKHYFYILLMTWASIFCIMVGSWLFLLVGVDLGDFTIFAPVMFVISGVALVTKMNWFDENVRQPLAATLEFGDMIEIVIHVQLFTIICGVIGLGLGIAAMTSFYPMGIELMLRSLAKGDEEWHNFTKYTPMSVLSGCSFGALFYSYLFADAKGQKKVMHGILLGGFVVFAILGVIFGTDRYFFVIQN